VITARDPFIDVARAFALLIMFFAHLLPHFSATEMDSYFLFRLLSSSAAPLFLFLTGLNFSNKQTLKEVLSKAAVFLGLAAFIDVALWQIIPFYSFDVLYCIGFGYPLLYFFSKARKWIQLVVIFGILLLSFQLQHNYHQIIAEHDINQWAQFDWNEVLVNFFYNGWFPIFPWLFFMLIGVLSKADQLHNRMRNWPGFLIGLAICALSIYSLKNGDLFLPEMAVELFYPASFMFILYATSFLYLFWFLQPMIAKLKETFFLAEFGRYSLFYYLLHLTILTLFTSLIEQIITLQLDPIFLLLLVYLSFILILFSFVWLIRLMKTSNLYQRYRQRLVLRMFFH
jgi:uncharacterized protein